MNATASTIRLMEPEFVTRVLNPYRDHCRYLKSVGIQSENSPTDSELWQGMAAQGEFSIDQSCYIDDTGHFNAVEFNICYNQLAYVFLANCIREKCLPALEDFDLPTFYEKQLSNYLIVSIQSHYHKPINPRQFYGEVRVASAVKRSKLSILETHCKFHDDGIGASDGHVRLAVLYP